MAAAVAFPASHRDLLDAPVASFVTLGHDGAPQVVAVWFLFDGEQVRLSLNGARQATRNLRRRPACNLFILDVANPDRYLEIRARAELAADADHALCRAYTSKYGVDPSTFDAAGSERYAVTLRPVRVRPYDVAAETFA